jgi:threonine aldolase
LAGACLYALEYNLPNLAFDHTAAENLANGLKIKGFDVETPETNMVWINLPFSCTEFSKKLAKSGIRIFGGTEHYCRVVIHHQNREYVKAFLDAV